MKRMFWCIKASQEKMRNQKGRYNMEFNYNINPISKDYFFLTSTERALIERSLMDWHLQNYVQGLVTPETTLDEVIDGVLLVESMETLIYGGDWQDSEPKEGSMILAVRPEIYNLFKAGRTKNTEEFFKEQNWNYTGQFVKK